MKKTIERLQKDAIESLQYYDKILRKFYGKRVDQLSYDAIMQGATQAIWSIYNYAKVLEDAYSELAEPLDKKLEAMEKAVKNIGKPVRKKEETKKPPYRV